MNTTKKGDLLEDKAIAIIDRLLDEALIGIMKDYVKVFKKKKYPSRERNGDVEFDLSIEVWPPNADRYSIVYFIECKNYKTRVSIDKVKKFYADIQETSALNAKGILITNTPLQSGAYDYANSKRLMVIQGESADNFNIILHKRNIEKENLIPILGETLDYNLIDEGVQNLAKLIDKQILIAFVPPSRSISYGIDLLKKSDIESISLKELNNINPEFIDNAYGLSINDLKDYLKQEYDLEVTNFNPGRRQYLGTCDIANNTIGISKHIVNTPRELFVLAHEFGHYILHQNLSINQQLLDSFSDSKFDFSTGKNRLENPRHWIEWQANYFSASILLPRTSITAKLWQFQQREGLIKGNLFLNDEYRTQRIFNKIITRLSTHFNVSKTSIIYRLREYKLITDKSRVKSIGDLISDYKTKFFT